MRGLSIRLWTSLQMNYGFSGIERRSSCSSSWWTLFRWRIEAGMCLYPLTWGFGTSEKVKVVEEYEHHPPLQKHSSSLEFLTFIASVYFIGILCYYSLPDIVADFFWLVYEEIMDWVSDGSLCEKIIDNWNQRGGSTILRSKRMYNSMGMKEGMAEEGQTGDAQ